MKRQLAAALVIALLGSPLVAADEEKKPEEKWPPRYENPILSLLFLPVRILVGVASVFEPEKRERDAEAPSGER